jgi:hypothetical protein
MLKFNHTHTSPLTSNAPKIRASTAFVKKKKISDVHQSGHNINIMNKNATGQSKLKSHSFQAVMKSAPLSVGTSSNNFSFPRLLNIRFIEQKTDENTPPIQAYCSDTAVKI